MKPPPFKYLAPADLDEALALLAEHGGDARVLAGGQSLVPILNFRLAAPAALIDLNPLAALRKRSRDADGALRLGAMTRMREIETAPGIAAANPLLACAATHVAHVQIRNRGTLGGSLAHADPAAEMPGVALACDATIRLRNATGQREVLAADFFEAVFTTAAADDEIVEEIVFPAWPAGRRWGFREVSRREGDFAMVGIAGWLDLDADGACTDVRLVAVGAGDTPLRLPSAEAALRGRRAEPQAFAEAARAASGDVDPGDDIHASAEYRREVAGVLVGRVLDDCLARAA